MKEEKIVKINICNNFHFIAAENTGGQSGNIMKRCFNLSGHLDHLRIVTKKLRVSLFLGMAVNPEPDLAELSFYYIFSIKVYHKS